MTANARQNPEMELVKQKVQQKFAEMRAALHMREKLLMRQIEVIEQQQLSHHSRRHGSSSPPLSTRKEVMSPSSNSHTADVTFLPDYESDVLSAIRRFGRFELDNVALALQDVLYLPKEDYITPSNDHETMYKCLATTCDFSTDLNGNSANNNEPDNEHSEAIIVDFSQNKTLLEHNRKHMKDSIINITLLEAKELIRSARVKRDHSIPPLNLEELDDELESSIADVVSSLGVSSGTGRTEASSAHTSYVAEQIMSTQEEQPTAGGGAKKNKKNRFKPKITINNCNGTINLRNIASLTINCATEDKLSAEIPLPQDRSADSEENDDKSGQGNSAGQLATPATLSSSNNSGCTSTTTSSSQDSSGTSAASSRSQSKKQKIKKANYSKIKKSSTTSSSATATQSTPPENKRSNDKGDEFSGGTSLYPYELEDETEAAVTCDFYNRLLNEIKHSIKEKSTICESRYLQTHRPLGDRTDDGGESDHYTLNESIRDAVGSSVLNSDGCGKRLILKNFENLKVVLEANSDDDAPPHPVQIEQWLAEIISETDLEPMQNTDILEHSRLHVVQESP